jgi:hypothetical protein
MLARMKECIMGEQEGDLMSKFFVWFTIYPHYIPVIIMGVIVLLCVLHLLIQIGTHRYNDRRNH